MKYWDFGHVKIKTVFHTKVNQNPCQPDEITISHYPK